MRSGAGSLNFRHAQAVAIQQLEASLDIDGGNSEKAWHTIRGPGIGKGFVVGSEVITSASVIFTFFDDMWDPRREREESVTIDLGGDIFGGVTPFLFFGNLSGSLSLLSSSGALDYIVTVTTGDLRLTSATLTACSKPVPDSASTVALLGLGLLGLTVARRRLAVR